MTLARLLALGALLLSTGAQAHYPTLDCTLQAQQLTCITGFSDGTRVGDATLQVMSYQDELIKTYQTDQDGRASFLRPEGEFYIIFDAGHEDPAEFDYAEL